jgi:transcriptional regulator with GAF, ATPase, and Fis domain
MEHPDYAAFRNAVAAANDQPTATYAALRELADKLIGAKLFTLMSFDFETSLAARFYSNMPDAYPVSGTKPVNTDHWATTVLVEKKVFVANTIAEIADVFPDHKLIKSLGCESCINVPVVIGGTVAGTINILNEAGHYTPERIAAAEALKLPGALCFLLNERTTYRGA